MGNHLIVFNSTYTLQFSSNENSGELKSQNVDSYYELLTSWWLFAPAGNVIRAEISEDEQKKSKGYGTVQFETAMEALNAISILS